MGSSRGLRRATGWLERHRALIVVVLLVVTLAGVVVLVDRLAALTDGTEIVIKPPSPEIYVYVEGEVAHPGVYQLEAGDLVADAVEAAGGFTPNADRSATNLATPLRDGDQVHVYAVGDVSQRVNLNTAEGWLLDLLPGIGEVLAQRIIDYREVNGVFRQIEDLMMVEGVGPSTFGKLRDMITVR